MSHGFLAIMFFAGALVSEINPPPLESCRARVLAWLALGTITTAALFVWGN